MQQKKKWHLPNLAIHPFPLISIYCLHSAWASNNSHSRLEPSVGEHFLKIQIFHIHSLSYSDFGYIRIWSQGPPRCQGVSNDMFTCCIKLAYILSFIYYVYLSSHSWSEISAIANFQWKKPVGGGKAGSDWSFSYSLPSYSDIWMSLMSKSYPDIRILRYSLKALVPMRTVKLKTSVFQYS